MKRSEISKALKEPEAMCEKHCCYLPPYQLLCNEYPKAKQGFGYEKMAHRKVCHFYVRGTGDQTVGASKAPLKIRG